MEITENKFWLALTAVDAHRMSEWLAAVGFVEHATYRDDADPSVVVHAEWVWPDGGGVMFGTARPEAGGGCDPGAGASYLVVGDPDAVFDRAVAAGATVLRPMVEETYGGRGGTVADPEGNQWSFGSYQPG